MDVPVALQASNTLSVQVRGNPGGELTTQIVGVDNGLPTISPTSGRVGSLITLTGLNFTSCGPIPQVTLLQQGGGAISAPVSTFNANSLNFVVPDGAATGPVTVTVGTLSATSSGVFTVTTSSSFNLAVTPSSGTMIQGQSVAFAVSLSSNNGFSGLASLNVSGVPSGVSASFKPALITTGQISVLTLSAPANQALGASTLSISASATINGQSVRQSATASLQVSAVSTSLLGRTVVDDSRRTPIGGVTIKFRGKDDKGNITGCSAQTTSDAAGNFALTGLPAACTGPQLISYDGSTATSPAGKFAGVNLSYTLAPSQVTTSPVLIHLPRIDIGETVQVQQNASTDQVFTFHSIPHLKVTVYAGTTFSLDDGSQPNPFPLIALDVPVDRLPDLMPTSGTLTPFIVAFQPANAVASQPVAVNFPNSLNVPPGQTATLMTLDPTRGFMVPYGTGTVSSDGTQFVPDPDPANPGHLYGLVHFDWHGPTVPPCTDNCGPPPCDPTQECCPANVGDVETRTGGDLVRATDIAINGSRWIVSVVRTMRTMNGNLGPFGVGTNHNYGYEVDDSQLLRGTGTFVNLVTPEGGQFPFIRQPDGSFVNTAVPAYRGAVISSPSFGVFNLRWKDGTVYQFQTSALGALLAFLNSITDPNANTITLTRNPSDPFQLTQIKDPVGRSLTLTYDGSDRITSITDPIGRKVSYTYTSQGRLATVTDLAGGTTSYSYDNAGHLLTITDPRGVASETNIYDTNGRVTQQVKSDGGVFQFQYQLLNPIVANSPVLNTAITDPLGNTTTYRYTPMQLLMDVTDPSGQSTTFSRNVNANNAIQAVQGTANCPSCSNPAIGNLAFTFDQNGNTFTQTDALGNTTSFTFDPTFNKVTSIMDPLGNVTRFKYDSHGNLLTRGDPNGNITSFAYNSFGQVIQTADPAGNKTTFNYDAAGNLSQITDPLGNSTSFSYDALSRLTSATDAMGRTSTIFYDALGRVGNRVDSKGNPTQFTYDANGNLLSVTDARGNHTSFTYDPKNRLLTRTDPLGKTDSRTYDLNGNLSKFVDRRGQTSQFTYDALNRLVSESYQDGSAVSRDYDANGRLIHVSDSSGGAFDFSYDAVGHVVSSATQFGTVQYSYNAAGRVTFRQVVGQSAVQYSYDAGGNLTGASLPQASALFTFDTRNKILGINRANGVSTAFTYDALGRILSVNHSGASGALNLESYTYDAVGNRISNATNIAQSLITQATNSAFDTANRLLTSGTKSYSSDADGNLISITDSTGTTNLTWDTRNRLQTISQPNGQKTSFMYDFAGTLIQQQDSGPGLNLTQNFVLDDITNLAYVSRSNGDNWSILSGRVIDQHLAVVHSSADVGYGLADAINSTVSTVDRMGRIVGQFLYEPYGQTTASGSSYPFQFTGRTLAAGNLYYYRARFYSPATGRFISEDPSQLRGGDINLYRYAKNDPINRKDPSGLGYFCRRYLNFCCGGSLYHEQLFFEDGTNVGYFPDGIHSDTTFDYFYCDPRGTYDDDILREAVDYASIPGAYGAVNCQTWADLVRRIYSLLGGQTHFP